MAWQLLEVITSDSGVEHRSYLSKLCEQWGKAGVFNRQLVQAIRSYVGSKHNRVPQRLVSFALIITASSCVIKRFRYTYLHVHVHVRLDLDQQFEN